LGGCGGSDADCRRGGDDGAGLHLLSPCFMR
jgi:hypothetical protein